MSTPTPPAAPAVAPAAATPAVAAPANEAAPPENAPSPVMRYLNNRLKDLADILPSLLSEPLDRELRRHFLCFLYNDYLVPRPDRDPSGAERAIRRLEEILTGNLSWRHRYELLTRTT